MLLSKNWREIKLYIEQVINMIDTQEFFREVNVSEEAWGKDGTLVEEDPDKKQEACFSQNPP